MEKAMTDKCLLCFSEHIVETEDEHQPFACGDCGAWGMSADDVSTPDTADEDYRCGQVGRRLTDDPEDVRVPGWA